MWGGCVHVCTCAWHMCLVGRWSLYAVGGDGCETDIQSSFWNSVFSCSEIEDDKTQNKLELFLKTGLCCVHHDHETLLLSSGHGRLFWISRQGSWKTPLFKSIIISFFLWLSIADPEMSHQREVEAWNMTSFSHILSIAISHIGYIFLFLKKKCKEISS